MTLVTGRLLGRRFLAWLRHRRYWVGSGGGVPEGARITEDGAIRLTEDGAIRVIEG